MRRRNVHDVVRGHFIFWAWEAENESSPSTVRPDSESRATEGGRPSLLSAFAKATADKQGEGEIQSLGRFALFCFLGEGFKFLGELRAGLGVFQAAERMGHV